MAIIHHFTGKNHRYDWENVRTVTYDDGPAKSVTGKIMIGRDEDARFFVFRYFCVEPGGHSTLNDYHAHDHGVLILHGRAEVWLDDGVFELDPMDIIYIKPWEHHSLRPIGNEPMGFLCVIPNKELLQSLSDGEPKSG